MSATKSSRKENHMAKAKAAPKKAAPKAKAAEAQTTENVVTLADLQNEFGYAPHYIRKVLRAAQEVGDFQHEKRARYQWSEGDQNLEDARRIMREHGEAVKRAAEERAAAKASAEEDADEDDEDMDDEGDFDEDDE